ncbi:TetR/AcrR family transcriptional regulator [Corynebacterium aquatimens]|uniref:TetR/AcrR family transcriptional regulator n=1 Tax=Corynebacterium TaxID=1716 RepID=UPI001F206007|nr:MULTISPECIES: TetR/AcrR family transcriptional regulator [Corynebacterium]QYH18969.1 TetR/AcrR family transcriptional regulator [Corynebacterium aquatimens]UIZ92190.1 TetR/AcrR family transcriptional regulator [Corynebacterium sp. CNCTC7651]
MARREASTDPRAVRTRQALLNATVTLLDSTPAHELSVTSIVREAGVSRQVFYEHFADRDAVLLAAGLAVIEPAYREFVETFSPNTDYPQQVARLFEGLGEQDNAVRSLMNSAARGELNNHVVEILYGPVREQLVQHLEAADVQATDSMVDDTAYFLAAGTQAVFARGFAERVPAEELGQRIEDVRRTLGAYSMGQGL